MICSRIALISAIATGAIIVPEPIGGPFHGSPETGKPQGTTFLVDNVSDDGPGSLRQAIEEANRTRNVDGRPDRIVFDVPGEGPHVITLYSALPPITDPLVIDGFSQPRLSFGLPEATDREQIGIELDGSWAGEAHGLVVSAGNSVIRGLAIRGFSGDGIQLIERGRNRIEGNLIGSGLTADSKPGNGGSGVSIANSANNVVGGPSAAAPNAISGSAKSGITVVGADSVGNSILGNSIHDNAGPGIELQSDEAPDPGRSDLGPNNLQESPTLTSVTRLEGEAAGTDVWIEGTFESTPDTQFRLEFFATRPRFGHDRGEESETSSLQDARRQGEHLIIATDVTTDGEGTVRFLVVVPQGVESRALVTATATDPEGNTSEFSEPVVAPAVVKTWNNASGGNWSTGANWTPPGVPVPSDDAEIILSGTYTVTLDMNAAVVSLTLGAAAGTQTLSIGSTTLTLNGSSMSNPNSVIDVTGTGGLAGTGTLSSAGVIKKSGGTGITNLGVRLNNSGSATAQIGTISLTAGGSHTGSFNSSGGTVQFNGGSHDLNPGSSLVGPIQLLSGTLYIKSPISTQTFTLSGGTLILNSDFSVQTFTHSAGTLTGPGTLTVSGVYTWTAGTQAGIGVTAANGGMNVSGNAYKYLDQRRLDNAGTAIWNINGYALRMSSGARIYNTGIWEFQTNDHIQDWGASGSFYNSGTLRKVAPGTATTTVGVRMEHSGSVTAQSGVISLTAGGGYAGSLNGAGGTVQFNGGSHDLNAGSSMTGAVQLLSGTLNVNGPAAAQNFSLSGGTLILNTDFSVQSFAQSSGTLTGPGTLTVSGVYNWTAGTQAGIGLTAANGGMNASGDAYKYLDQRRLDNAGTAIWSINGYALRMSNGARVYNTGIWEFQTNDHIQDWGASGSFYNSGTFRKVAPGTATTIVGVRMEHSGSVTAQSGVISLTAGGSYAGSLSGAGGTVQFNGGSHDLNAGSSMTGSVQLFSGTLNVNSATVAQNFSLSGGTLILNRELWCQAFNHSGGTLTGPSTLTVSGVYNWTGGTQAGGGVTVANGGLDVSGSSYKYLDQRTLNNAATAILRTGGYALRMSNGAVVNNTGIWQDQANDHIQEWGASGPFINFGTFKKTSGTSTSNVSVPFWNRGSVQIDTGILNVSGSSYTQTAGTTKLMGGALTSTTTSINIDGGALAGSGTVTGRVNVTGTGSLAPGLSPGILSLVGSYTQGSTGTFDVEIGGPVPGSQHDRVNISGTGSVATLAGDLKVCLINNFVPALGDSFTIMTYPSRTGTFTRVIPCGPACVGWTIRYDPTAAVLTATRVASEITGLIIRNDKVTLDWGPASACAETRYDVVRGPLIGLPVGSQPMLEVCLASQTLATQVVDATSPIAGSGNWYLVRARIAGGLIGSYGLASNGAQRISVACP